MAEKQRYIQKQMGHMKAILYDRDNKTETSFALWKKSINLYDTDTGFYESSDQQFADVGISWGIRSSLKVQQMCLRHVVCEQGFLGNRQKNRYIGYAELTGMGKSICPHSQITGRGEEWYGELKPLKKKKRNVVILGQVPGDSSLFPLCEGETNNQVATYKLWMNNVISLLPKDEYEVRWKGHPYAPIPNNELRGDMKWFDNLSSAFDWADIAVAFNSNSLVDAALAGLYVIPAHPGSLAWSIRSSIGDYRKLSDADRINWLDEVASYQWSMEEISSGKCWGHIRAYGK